ncbi:hypothetical protein, partial [Dongia rigui]|nr:hypothetical protein [Dongia rigui]
QADLAVGGSVLGNGSAVADTLIVKSATIDLTNTTLTGVEILKAGLSAATNFTVDSLDLAAGGSVIGSSGSDTLTTNDTALDLTSTTLTSIEKLAAGTGSDTTFTVNQADLAAGGSVTGGAGTADTLVITGTSFDISSTSVTSVEKLQAGSNAATTFTVNQADLASGGTIIGGAGSDTLTTKEAALNLTSTT